MKTCSVLSLFYTWNKTAALAYCCKEACTQRTFPFPVACPPVSLLMEGKNIQLAVTWTLRVFFSKWHLFKDLLPTCLLPYLNFWVWMKIELRMFFCSVYSYFVITKDWRCHNLNPSDILPVCQR